MNTRTLTNGSNGLECGQSLLTGVSCTPAMILGSVNQVNVSVPIVVPSQDGDRGETSDLGVCIHVFYGQLLVVVGGAEVGLPLIVVSTSIVSENTCNITQRIKTSTSEKT